MSTGHERLPQWLRANRGDATQEWLASDIERVTGWHITRDRYSKYESGSLPIGKQVLRHFTDYWASRNVGGPADFMAPSGDGTTPAPDVAAYLSRIDSLVTTVNALLEELRASRRERDDLAERVGALETAAKLQDPSDEGADDGTPAPHQTKG